jgi:hypothetical protein
MLHLEGMYRVTLHNGAKTEIQAPIYHELGAAELAALEYLRTVAPEAWIERCEGIWKKVETMTRLEGTLETASIKTTLHG